jgi:large subunit ribosomal protein L25
VLFRSDLLVDLTRVDLNEEIQTGVPIEFFNEPTGLNKGDVLQTQLDSLPVRCAVSDLPELLRVDLSKLTPDQAITAGMIELPANVELDTEPDDIVVTVASVRQSETEIEGEAEQIGAEGAEPELVRDEKPEDEGEEEGEKES